MSNPSYIGITPRVRKSPFYDATIRHGVQGFTVYNHMLLPIYYESPEADYKHLMAGVTLWDVAAERQVELKGPDAYHLARLLTPRNLEKFPVGLCKYVPIVDENGGMINDPLALRIAEDKIWLSLADSDVLLWVKGIAYARGLDVTVTEPDVSPLAIQGPKSNDLAELLFGNWVRELKFFRFKPFDFDGIPLIIARSGWSKQGGFELYLRDRQYGDELWERIMQTGQPLGIKPATPNAIERVESGLLSYGTDMTLENNPLEIGLSQYCDLDQNFEFIGKAALQKIRAEGIKQKLVGLEIDAEDKLYNEHFWPVFKESTQVGKVTSAIYSPKLQKNIAMAMIDSRANALGTALVIHLPSKKEATARVIEMPFV